MRKYKAKALVAQAWKNGWGPIENDSVIIELKDNSAIVFWRNLSYTFDLTKPNQSQNFKKWFEEIK